MQAWITDQEKEAISGITAMYSRTKWFCAQAGISWSSLNKLRTIGQADEEQIEKARALLKTPEARKLIAKLKQQAIAS